MYRKRYSRRNCANTAKPKKKYCHAKGSAAADISFEDEDFEDDFPSDEQAVDPTSHSLEHLEQETLAFRPTSASSPIPFDENTDGDQDPATVKPTAPANGASASLSSDGIEDLTDEALYEASDITAQEYQDQLLELAAGLKFSDAAVAQVNEFIARILPIGNNCPTKHQLLKLDQEDFDFNVRAKNFQSGTYYTISIDEQVESLVDRHPQIMTFQPHKSDKFCDIFDGQELKKVQLPSSNIVYLYCLLNCDGVAPVHKSKGFKIWPATLVVMNLGPLQRRKFDNLILTTLYYGKSKPDFSVFLEEFKNSIELFTLEKNGRLLKIKVLALVAYLPAKAECLNMTAFNGYHGCTFCEATGLYLTEFHKMTYPIEAESAKLRDAKSHAKNAIEAKFSRRGVKFGVKGVSALSGLIEIPIAAPFDSMHLVYLGVTKVLTVYAVNKRMIDREKASSQLSNSIVP